MTTELNMLFVKVSLNNIGPEYDVVQKTISL